MQQLAVEKEKWVSTYIFFCKTDWNKTKNEPIYNIKKERKNSEWFCSENFLHQNSHVYLKVRRSNPSILLEIISENSSLLLVCPKPGFD